MPIALTEIPIVPSIVALAGAGTAMYGMYRREGFSEAMQWPVAEGTVSDSRVEEFVEPARGADDRPSTMFRPVVAIDYTVGGREYRTRRFAHSEVAMSWESGARDLLEHYPKGARVVVRVNPSNHADAIVAPETARGWTGLVIGGGTLVAIGALIWIVRGPF
jgi:ribosomal protein L21E